MSQVIVISPEELQQIVTRAVADALKQGTPSGEIDADPQIITGEELCKKLGVSAGTLITYRKRGKIPFLVIGNSIRYDYLQVIKALTQKKPAK